MLSAKFGGSVPTFGLQWHNYLNVVHFRPEKGVSACHLRPKGSEMGVIIANWRWLKVPVIKKYKWKKSAENILRAEPGSRLIFVCLFVCLFVAIFFMSLLVYPISCVSFFRWLFATCTVSFLFASIPGVSMWWVGGWWFLGVWLWPPFPLLYFILSVVVWCIPAVKCFILWSRQILFSSNCVRLNIIQTCMSNVANKNEKHWVWSNK